MNKILNWGIIGTGNIANTFAEALATSKKCKLAAVGSRSQDLADKFGKKYKISKCYGSYEALLADKDVQAVYISTPHPFHAEWAIKAANASKHILCEKPLAMNYPEALAIIVAARKNNVFLMEAFMYRCHPQTAKIVEILKQKTIGDVHLISAAFCYQAEYDLQGRALNKALGGGAILDIGCYPVSAARLIAGVANGKKFEEPIELKAVGNIIKASQVDESAAASLKFPGGIIAELSTSTQFGDKKTIAVYGTNGSLIVPAPWSPARKGGKTKIIVTDNESKTREIIVDCRDYLYAIEADIVADNIDKRQAPWPAMSWDDTLGNMKVLDWWRKEIGMVYDSE